MDLSHASAHQQDQRAPDGTAAKAAAAAQPAARQERVLAAVLDLMMTAGPHFSMADVARAAACSKETLYRWFGDRDGLLTATVQWQAAKVLMPTLPDAGLDRATYQAVLAAFAASWIGVISGEPSIALNRQAVGESGGLGRIVLEHGPLAMARRLAPVFEIGRREGHIAFDSFENAFSLFFGLVVGDLQIRCLLGDPWRPQPGDIAERARRAAAGFMTLTVPTTPARP
jgi:AcrR family transcriptional regulator